MVQTSFVGRAAAVYNFPAVLSAPHVLAFSLRERQRSIAMSATVLTWPPCRPRAGALPRPTTLAGSRVQRWSRPRQQTGKQPLSDFRVAKADVSTVRCTRPSQPEASKPRPIRTQIPKTTPQLDGAETPCLALDAELLKSYSLKRRLYPTVARRHGLSRRPWRRPATTIAKHTRNRTLKAWDALPARTTTAS